jgi:hypothetical protein
MVFLYILQLEQGKYYVGKTIHPEFRIDQHFLSNGSAWTKKYKPISVLKIIPNCDDYDEDKQTIQCMEKYGLENVRGGSFCEIILSDTNRHTLRQMIKGATDKCYTCGKNGHFAQDCTNKYKQNNQNNKNKKQMNPHEKCDCPTSYFSSHRRFKCVFNQILDFLDESESDSDSESESESDSDQNGVICYRCGRQGHYSTACYAYKHLKGYSLS